MKPVRVLHVLHSMNCGGAETLIMNIYRKIDREKVQFDFLVNVSDEMFFDREIQSLGGRIFSMPFLTAASVAAYEKNLLSFFEEHREIKIVHSHLETTTGLILRQARRAGVTVRIAHSHNSRFTHTGLSYLPENLFKSYCRTKIVPNATALFGCSELANSWLYRGRGDTATLIKNGIDTEQYAFCPQTRERVRNELGIGEKTVVLGHVGRFNDQKNHAFLIEIFEKYTKINPDTLLLLAGEGVLLDSIRSLVHDKHLTDKVVFLGLRSDTPELMQAFDLFLLPSKFEGLPLVIVEAQAAGLHCLAADTISTMADMGCGLLEFLPIDDANKWADAIGRTDRAHLDTHSDVARAGYDIRDTAKMLEKFYLDGAGEYK